MNPGPPANRQWSTLSSPPARVEERSRHATGVGPGRVPDRRVPVHDALRAERAEQPLQPVRVGEPAAIGQGFEQLASGRGSLPATIDAIESRIDSTDAP